MCDFFWVLKQHVAGRKGRKKKKKEEGEEAKGEGGRDEEYGHGRKSTDHRYGCVWV